MPAFERYPGPPARTDSAHLHRVISPWRDALAWISIAGPLTIARYLLRHGDGWRDVPVRFAGPEGICPSYSRPQGSAYGPPSPTWILDSRDPVELRFVTVVPGLHGRASVTVDRNACEIVLELRNLGEREVSLAEVAALDGAAPIPAQSPSLHPGQHGTWTIRLPATGSRRPPQP